MPTPTANKFKASSTLFALLGMIERGDVLTVARVQERLEVCERQARDYLAFLENQGKIEPVRRGRVIEYHRRSEGSTHHTLGRAIGTAYAIAALGALEGTVFHDDVVAWLRAEADGLAQRSGQGLRRLRHAFHPVAASSATNPRYAEHAEEAIEAIRRGRRLRGKYERLVDGGTAHYELRPQALVLHRDGLRLLARKKNGDLRMFDVEGFETLTITKGRGAEPEGDPASHFHTAFGRYMDYPAVPSRLRVSGLAARQLRRRRYHGSQRILADEGEWIEVTFQVGLCPDYLGWLLSWMPDIEVLEPVDLRSLILERLQTAADRHQGNTGAWGGDSQEAVGTNKSPSS